MKSKQKNKQKLFVDAPLNEMNKEQNEKNSKQLLFEGKKKGQTLSMSRVNVHPIAFQLMLPNLPDLMISDDPQNL